jgi:hypothetical protein
MSTSAQTTSRRGGRIPRPRKAMEFSRMKETRCRLRKVWRGRCLHQRLARQPLPQGGRLAKVDPIGHSRADPENKKSPAMRKSARQGHHSRHQSPIKSNRHLKFNLPPISCQVSCRVTVRNDSLASSPGVSALPVRLPGGLGGRRSSVRRELILTKCKALIQSWKVVEGPDVW